MFVKSKPKTNWNHRKEIRFSGFQRQGWGKGELEGVVKRHKLTRETYTKDIMYMMTTVTLV